MPDTTEEPTGAAELLAIYLRDHRAGAAAGLALVRRSREQEGSGELGETLTWLESQIEEDQRSLDSIMAGLDVSPSPLKAALGVAAERAGRLKLNARLFKRSPLSTLLELESLAAAIFTKRNLWRSLAAVAERSSIGDGAQLTELIRRAEEQLDRVQDHHDAVARQVFDAASTDAGAASPADSGTPSAPTTPAWNPPAGAAAAPVAPIDELDHVLDDAEGGIEGSLLDAPDDLTPPPS